MGNVPADFFRYMEKAVRYNWLKLKRKSGDIEIRKNIASMRRLQDENHKSNVSKFSGKKRHFTSKNIFTEYFES